MRTKRAHKKQILRPDPIYDSLLISRIINRVMKDGKKSTAARQIYKALSIIKEQQKSDPLEFLQTALDKIKPELEVRSRRVGGATYQVPVPVRPGRKETLAIRWTVKAATDRPNKTFHSFGEKFAAELTDATAGQGGAFKKKEDTHKMAEANKAFAHFRW
jgi:small subunit ribosomal protein S7